MEKRYKDTKYIIYDDGRCYSELSNRFLKPQLTNKYPTYNLTINGKKKKTYVHRMVAETFIPLVEGKNLVNHKDGNTHNYDISNLEWVSSKENSLHACANGLTPKGDQTINRFTENLPDEEWIELSGYPLYLISSCGRIMNHKTKRLLKPATTAAGYEQVSLWKNNVGTSKLVHQLVYTNFYNDFNLKNYVINHKDGNKKNNNKENLEKISSTENNLHAVYTINTNNCNKPVYQISKNGEIIADFPSIATASKITGIQNISRAIKTNGYAGGYKWQFK